MPLLAAVWMALAAVLLSYTRVGAQAPAASTKAAAPSAVAVAIAHLRSPDIAVRGQASTTLLKAGPDALPEILPRLSEARTRVQLYRIIGDMGPKGVAKLLALTSDPALAPAAAEALSLVARPDSAAHVPGLAACVKKHPELRDPCGRGLVRVSGPKAAPFQAPVLALARDADPAVRTYGLLAVAQIGRSASAATNDALAALGDASPLVRAAAARALGGIGRSTPAVTAALKKASGDSDAEAAGAAKKALKALAPAGAPRGGKRSK